MSAKFFGLVWLPPGTVACIVTRKGHEPTLTKHRCWKCYDILMLQAGVADTDPALYTLTCRGCATTHYANFPNGEIPAWLTHRILITWVDKELEKS